MVYRFGLESKRKEKVEQKLRNQCLDKRDIEIENSCFFKEPYGITKADWIAVLRAGRIFRD